MNKSDSERVALLLESIGYQSTSNLNEADLILVNMCSVRQSAVDRVYGLFPKFKKLKTKNKHLNTILTGCILKQDKKILKNGFDLILDIKNLSKWPNYLNKITTDRSLLEKNGNSPLINPLIKPKHKAGLSAFIPVSNGCNNFCSYCVIPFTRGREICRNHQEILKETKDAVKKEVNPISGTTYNNAKEIWLLGQNVNSYQSPAKTKVNFPALLKMINDIPGNFWIRFTTPHPLDFSDELINVMADCDKVTEYLNLPLQSGDNEILKKMNRPYTAEQYRKLVEKIREKIPKITLSTDVIVGFPSETKKQFENTAKLFKEIEFDMAYISRYSQRPGTKAIKIKDDITRQEKERRWKILTDILKKTSLKKNKKYINRIVDVLPEYQTKDYFLGKTREYKTINVQIPKSKFQINSEVQNLKLIGKFIKVRVTGALPWGLKGELLP